MTPGFYRAGPTRLTKCVGEVALLIIFATAFGVAAAFGVQVASARGIWAVDPMLEPLYILAATLPAAPLARVCTGHHPATLISVDERVRWGVIARVLAVSVCVYAIASIAASVVPAMRWDRFAVLCGVVALQAAAEELVFRAALPQVLGGLPAPLAYGLPALGFVALHTGSTGTLADVAVFAACAAWLTWRTGGVEAAWVLHVVGNVWVMGASVSTGPWGTVATVVATAVIGVTSPRR